MYGPQRMIIATLENLHENGSHYVNHTVQNSEKHTPVMLSCPPGPCLTLLNLPPNQ